MTTLMESWSRCLERLETEFPPEDVHTWLRPLQADQRGDSVILYAPNTFIIELVEERYLGRLRELLSYFSGIREVVLAIGSRPKTTELTVPVDTTGRLSQTVPFNGNLDTHYNFDNFVEGRSNQLARAAAWQAAQKPGDRTHNPLLLYGGTGLGKTHLMFAAGNVMRQVNPTYKVMYLRSEQFFQRHDKSVTRQKYGPV